MSIKTTGNVDSMYLTRLEIRTLSERLKELGGWLSEELDTTIARTVAFSDASDIPHRSDERVLVFNADASDTAFEILGTLRVWVEHVCLSRHQEWPGSQRIPFYAKWIDRHLIDLALTDRAAQAMDEITDAWKRALRAIDRPAEKEFAGPCQSNIPGVTCDGVYVTPKADTAKCRTCDVVCDVPRMQAQMHEEVKGRQYLGTELGTALTLLTGDTVAYGRVRNWINRDKLVASSVDRFGRKLYRLNDALEILEMKGRRSA